jgi:hypothetical protein
MPFELGRRFCILALGLSLINSVLAQSPSSSSVPDSSPALVESAVRAVVEKYFVLYSGEDLDGVMSLWSRRSPNYEAKKQALKKRSFDRQPSENRRRAGQSASGGGTDHGRST